MISETESCQINFLCPLLKLAHGCPSFFHTSSYLPDRPIRSYSSVVADKKVCFGCVRGGAKHYTWSFVLGIVEQLVKTCSCLSEEQTFYCRKLRHGDQFRESRLNNVAKSAFYKNMKFSFFGTILMATVLVDNQGSGDFVPGDQGLDRRVSAGHSRHDCVRDGTKHAHWTGDWLVTVYITC